MAAATDDTVESQPEPRAKPLGRFLDYGCGGCGLLETVRHLCSECHGVDVDSDKIEAAAARHPDLLLRVIGVDGRTPYPDGHFDSIAITEVIEHVPDEAATLAELDRILKPGGVLVLTTPHRGWLTFLDPGNLKFMFPRLHRFVHLRLIRNRAYFDQRFTRAEPMGLIGDITASDHRRPWHRHYKPRQIEAFCPPTLRPSRHAVYFPGLRGFMLLRIITRCMTFGRLRGLPWPLSVLERTLSRIQTRTGDQLVMEFRKTV